MSIFGQSLLITTNSCTAIGPLAHAMTTKTLRTKFVLWLIFAASLTGITTGGVQLYVEYQHRLDSIKREINSIESSVLPALEASVWALDNIQTQRLVNSIFALPHVQSVQLKGNGINSISLGGVIDGQKIIKREFNLIHSLDNSPHKLGVLTVQTSSDSIYAEVKNKAWMLIVAAAIQILTVAIVAGLLLQTLFLKPLQHMVHYFRKAPSLIDSKALALPELEGETNELTQLQAEINHFRRSLIENEVRNNLELRKFTALTQNNSEIIWRCDFMDPIDTKYDPETQRKLIYQRGKLTELNTPAKKTLRKSAKTTPFNLADLPFLQENVFDLLTQNQYKVKDVVTQYEDAQGNTRYFRNTLACWMEQGMLYSIWGIAIDVTQSLTTQKTLEQREQQLYLSQTRLSEAQALAHMGHWSYFTESEKLQTSDEFARIYGFDPDTKSITWPDLIKRIHPEDSSYIIHTLSDPRTTAAGAEHRIVWPNGEIRFVQAIARKNIVNGAVDSTFGILIDITDRRRAEEERNKSQRALVESEARLAQAQAIAHMGHWLLDCKSQKLLCSDEFYRLLGHAPQERQFDQQTFMSHIHHDDHPLVQHLLISAREKSFTNEFRVLRRDGVQRFMRGTFTPFYAGGESSARIFGIMMDVTEQKQVELQLRSSQELFATAFDSSPDGIFLLSNDNDRFIKVNRALTTMLKCEEENLLEKTFKSLPLFVDQSSKCHVGDFIKLQRSATNVEIKLEQNERTIINGLLSWQHVTVAKKSCVLGIIHDVTPLRQLQKTAAAQQQQLVQADKLASIGTMVAGVAHEINNPNHLIQMNAEILEGFCQPLLSVLEDLPASSLKTVINGLDLEEVLKTIPELLTDVRSSSQRISRIVNDLKDFSRPQEKSEYVPTQLNEVLEKTLNLLSSLLEKAPVTIETNFAKNLPLVMADSQRLEQVLVNLIMNAIEASDGGDKRIAIRTLLHEPDHKVRCEVEDEGQGISEDALPRIFDPFFTTKQDKGGTGLGLAISYRLIQEHGGTLTAHVKETGGTIMSIHLAAIPSAVMQRQKRH